ncbi:hypothetical protein BH10PSE2_BH10PSE2_09090 [soil metagenome]
MTHRLLPIAALVAVLPLSGCDRLTAAWSAFQTGPTASVASAPGQTGAAAVPVAVQPTAAPLTATGHGLPVKALPDETLQSEAGVFEVHPLAHQDGIKIYATAGGDPAMNGLQTYIAFYRSPAEGWWVFGLGDFLNFRILTEIPGRVDLEIEENTMDQATGTIGTRTRRAIVTYPVGPIDEQQPPNVRMIPAS